MAQARYGGNSSYGRVSKNYDPTLERPNTLTSSDKQLLGAGALGAIGGAQLVTAARLPTTAANQLSDAKAMKRVASARVREQKAKIDAARKAGNRPFHWGFDRDRPGGPIKNWANRRRYRREMPRLVQQREAAKERLTIARQNVEPRNLMRRRVGLGLTGSAVALGGAALGANALKNRRLEQEAGIR